MLIFLWILERLYKANLPSAARILLPCVGLFAGKRHLKQIICLIEMMRQRSLHASAIRLASIALTLDPSDRNLLKVLGLLHLLAGESEQALLYFSRRDSMLYPGKKF
jgi:hypothetical protein